jgi:hypothetical protein
MTLPLYPSSSCPSHFILPLHVRPALPFLFMSTSLYPYFSRPSHFAVSSSSCSILLLSRFMPCLPPPWTCWATLSGRSLWLCDVTTHSGDHATSARRCHVPARTELLSRRIRQESNLCGSHLCVHNPSRGLHTLAGHWFLVPRPTGLTTKFYCLTALEPSEQSQSQSSSWCQAPWGSRPEIFFNWTLAVIVLT